MADFTPSSPIHSSDASRTGSGPAHQTKTDATAAAQDVADEAKDKAAATADDATSAAKDVADTAMSKASELADQAKSEATDVAADAKGKATGVLDDVSKTLRDTGDSLDDQQHDAFASYARQAADQVEQFTSSIRERNVGEILDEAERFARRDPALFIGGAFLLGVVGGRFLKASRPDPSTASAPSASMAEPPRSSRPSAPATTSTPARPAHPTGPATTSAASVDRTPSTLPQNA